MKDKLQDLIEQAARRAFDAGALNSSDFLPGDIDEPKITAHGDFATNFAMVNAAAQKMPPRRIAEAVAAYLDDPEKTIDRTEIAGPGFINFFIRPAAWHPVLAEIHKKNATYGASRMGEGISVQVEFVSANPTGPLHVGHGRGAVVGDTVASLLSFCGYNVFREYYINDSGRQIQTLGRSVYLRCKELFGETVVFPEDGYQGDYIYDIARRILREHPDRLSGPENEAVEFCARFAATDILAGIREDLSALGVEFNNWYSEQSLFDSGKVAAAIEGFRKEGLIYEQEGALWFKTSDFGDEKDRVVVRGNGQTTYFAPDIAYHQDKFARGFNRIIDIWGADHHGYIPRIAASLKAAGKDPTRFSVILVQLVNLLRKGTLIAMSTRGGKFVTLREVVDEVGKDAARFIFLTRRHDSPLDFDLEVAKAKTNDNPVYYVQYVHARISSILRKAAEERGIREIQADAEAVDRLREPEEIQLLKHLANYPETVAEGARALEPHRIAFYLMDLAAAFHAYYNGHRVLTDDLQLAAGRLHLVLAVRKVIRNGLNLLGVSAPESM